MKNTLKRIYLQIVNLMFSPFSSHGLIRSINKILLNNIQFKISNPVWDTIVTIPTRNGDILFFSPAWDGYNSKLLSGKTSEPKTQELFSQIIAKAKNFLDIGAYTGIYTCLAKITNPLCFVECFEPNPAAVSILQLNIFLNKFCNVDILQVALANKNGIEALNTPQTYSNGHSSASLNNNFSELNIISFNVHVFRLDTLYFQNIDLIKVDIEDSEVDFIEGATNTLLEFLPVIFIECLNRPRLSKVRKSLSLLNYTNFFKIGGDFGDERNFCFFNKTNSNYPIIIDFCTKYGISIKKI